MTAWRGCCGKRLALSFALVAAVLVVQAPPAGAVLAFGGPQPVPSAGARCEARAVAFGPDGVLRGWANCDSADRSAPRSAVAYVERRGGTWTTKVLPSLAGRVLASRSRNTSKLVAGGE